MRGKVQAGDLGRVGPTRSASDIGSRTACGGDDAATTAPPSKGHWWWWRSRRSVKGWPSRCRAMVAVWRGMERAPLR